jgi:hypothetical protein
MSRHVEGGVTPHGGTSATIYFFDNKRKPVDESIATSCAIAEYDKEGNTIYVACDLLYSTKPNDYAQKK